MAAPDLPELLPLAEVAERLHVSRRTVHRMLAAGELPAVRFRGSVRVAAVGLAAFVERHTVTAAKPRPAA